VRIGSKSLWFLTVGGRSAPQFTRFLPGQTPAALAPQIYRSGPRPGLSGVPHVGRPAQALRNVTAEQALAQGIMFAGNPDTVFRRIKEFYDQVGGFDHLILMGRSGFMTRAESERASGCSRRRCCPACARSGPSPPVELAPYSGNGGVTPSGTATWKTFSVLPIRV